MALAAVAVRRRCALPSCRHADSRHAQGPCSCGCRQWRDRWPHWWRDLTVSTWANADAAWQADREATALGYPEEMAEYAREHPRPTFKRTLLALAGSTQPTRLAGAA